MEEVAAKAGTGKATLYRYFQSKEDLYVAVFDEALRALDARLREAMALPGAVTERLERLIHVLVPGLTDHLRGLRRFADGEVLVAERKRRLFRDHRHRIGGYLRDTLAEGMRVGHLRPLDPALAAEFVIGMIWAAAAAGPVLPTEELASGIVDVFLRGVIAPAKDGLPL